MASSSEELVWDQHWHPEIERTKSICQVSLWTRPVGSSKKKEVEPSETAQDSSKKKNKSLKPFSLSSTASVASSKKLARLAQLSHWLLLFQWPKEIKDEDGDSIFPRTHSYEAFDDNGKLVPHWSQYGPQGEEWKKRSDIGTLEISPKQVNQAAKTLWTNNKDYSALTFNCQVWTKALWEKIKGTENKDIPIKGIRTAIAPIKKVGFKEDDKEKKN